MTLEKAIEILEYKLQFLNYPDLADFKDAMQLGMEALKRIKAQRNSMEKGEKKLLPGETEEDG